MKHYASFFFNYLKNYSELMGQEQAGFGTQAAADNPVLNY